MNNKIVKRGKTQRFRLNEDYIFGGPRCMRCRKVLQDDEKFICCKFNGDIKIGFGE